MFHNHREPHPYFYTRIFSLLSMPKNETLTKYVQSFEFKTLILLPTFAFFMTECSHMTTFYIFEPDALKVSRSKCQRVDRDLWSAIGERLPWLLMLAHHVRHSSTTHKRAFVLSCSHQCVFVCACERDRERHRVDHSLNSISNHITMKSHVHTAALCLVVYPHT